MTASLRKLPSKLSMPGLWRHLVVTADLFVHLPQRLPQGRCCRRSGSRRSIRPGRAAPDPHSRAPRVSIVSAAFISSFVGAAVQALRRRCCRLQPAVQLAHRQPSVLRKGHHAAYVTAVKGHVVAAGRCFSGPAKRSHPTPAADYMPEVKSTSRSCGGHLAKPVTSSFQRRPPRVVFPATAWMHPSATPVEHHGSQFRLQEHCRRW